MTLDPKLGAAALLPSMVGDAEAELPEAEGGVTEPVLLEGTLEELTIDVVEAVEEAVAGDVVAVVFVVLDEPK